MSFQPYIVMWQSVIAVADLMEILAQVVTVGGMVLLGTLLIVPKLGAMRIGLRAKTTKSTDAPIAGLDLDPRVDLTSALAAETQSATGQSSASRSRIAEALTGETLSRAVGL